VTGTLLDPVTAVCYDPITVHLCRSSDDRLLDPVTLDPVTVTHHDPVTLDGWLVAYPDPVKDQVRLPRSGESLRLIMDVSTLLPPRASHVTLAGLLDRTRSDSNRRAARATPNDWPAITESYRDSTTGTHGPMVYLTVMAVVLRVAWRSVDAILSTVR
jgi:hypothetical protein